MLLVFIKPTGLAVGKTECAFGHANPSWSMKYKREAAYLWTT